MKKKLWGVSLGLALGVTALSGCHKAKEMDAFRIPETFDTSKTYSITFWSKNDTNKTQVNIYQQAINDFEALYPNIKVNMRLYTDYGKIYNDVITNIATGTTPNLCITYPDHIATYLKGANVCVPLDELLTDTAYGLGGSAVRYDGPTKDDIIPQFLSECYLGDHCYALPYMRSTECCYINEDFVRNLGYELPEVLTWDFIWEVSEKAMQTYDAASGTYALNGQKVLIPFIYKSTDNMMIQMLHQLQAGYSDSEGNIQLFNDTTKQQLLEIADHAGSKAFSTFKISSYPANFLNAGQCIFAIDSTAGATWMGSEAPLLDISADKLVSFNTAVRMVPQFDTAHPQMISQGPSLCLFNKADSGEVMASWLFMQYLLSDKVQMAYSQTEGYVPVTQTAQNHPDYMTYLSLADTDNALHYGIKLRASQLLLDNTANTFTTPVFNGSASLRDAAGQLIEEVTKAKRRKQPVNDASLDILFSDVTALYHLNQMQVGTSKKELGALPKASVALVAGLLIVWVLILAYVGRKAWRAHKKQ